MPTLNWIGKDAVVNHHKEVPFHLLKCDEKLSVASQQTSEFLKNSEVSHTDSLLVQDDNLIFWLQTSSDKLYPDFVCELTNGKFLVVEYKGEHLWSNEDSKDKENDWREMG